MAKESPFVEIDFEADESITLPFNAGEEKAREICGNTGDEEVENKEERFVENIPAVTCESAYFKPCSMFNASGLKIISDVDNKDKSKEENYEAFNLLEPKIELDTKSDWEPSIKPEFDSVKGGYVCEICFNV